VLLNINLAAGSGFAVWQSSTQGRQLPSIAMTPFQFARAECANYDQQNGACKGLGIKDDGSLFSFGSKPACVLSDRKARCAYFETCVLPMHFDASSQAGQVRAKAHQEAVNLYVAGTTGQTKSKRPICPHCRKREIEPPKRFCYQCAEDRKKASDQAGGAARQQKARQSRKTPSGTIDSIASNEGAE
jgi:hypothetical protein